MNDDERFAVAMRWMDALSKTGVKSLKALEEVLEDDVRTPNMTGRAAVLDWFKTFKGLSMFRTGTWQEPSVDGDVVTVKTLFHEKAAYYGATLSVTVTPAGTVRYANLVIAPAPSPLGDVIHRVWGRRAGADLIPDHLSETYGVTVKKIMQLDHGVFRVDLAKGEPWVARVFPSDRPVSHVEGDAAVLRFLESKGFPAERCVADVSVHEGQGVLVTGFLAGTKPKPSAPVQSKLGDLVGRLHAMKGAPEAARRDAGALHLFTMDCTVASEIETARASLDAAAFRGKDKMWDALHEAITSADDFATMPKALMHPDPASVNAISSSGKLALIDWAGAGSGPRILGLGLLLIAAAAGKTFNREWTDAVMNAYTEHVRLEASELERLEEAVAHRLLIHEIYSWSVGMATQRKPGSRKDWPHNNEGIARMADYIRENWG